MGSSPVWPTEKLNRVRDKALIAQLVELRTFNP